MSKDVIAVLDRDLGESLYYIPFIVAYLQEEIYSSSYAAAAYLESIKFPKDKKVNSKY